MNYITAQGVVSTIEAIRYENPNMSIPEGADLSDIGHFQLEDTPKPEHPEWWLAEQGLPEQVNGFWRTTWIVREMTFAEGAERARVLISDLEVASGSPARIVREGLILLIESQATAQGLTLEYLRAKNKGYRLLKECDEQIALLRKRIP